MSGERRSRIERVLAGVIRQVCADAGATRVAVAGADCAAAWARSICEQAVGPESLGAGGLVIDPTSKTVLLLGACPPADVLLFGDLYYSQVVELAGAVDLPPAVVKLAAACGGPELLDRILCRFFDERFSWPDAVSELPSPARELLVAAVEAGRFGRAHIGLVPKLGARTLGIDLYA